LWAAFAANLAAAKCIAALFSGSVSLLAEAAHSLSPDRLLVLAQVTLDGDLPLREASAVLDSLRERVRAAVPMKVWVRIAPAV
jgi:divalent metal cation (Fe/Co/Zn/Cd) transporter